MNNNEQPYTLKNGFKKIAKDVGEHFNTDGVNPHPLATEISNGLMSAESYRQARGYEIKDNQLDLKYSFWKIPTGFYATVYNGNGGWDNDGLNLPDGMVKGDLIHLHVYAEDNRRRIYYMYVQKNGMILYLNTSNNQGSGGGNTNSTNWKHLKQETLLFKGEAGFNEEMTLSDSTRRFRTLKFLVEGSGLYGMYETTAYDNPSISYGGLADTVEEGYLIKIGFTDMQNQKVLKMTRCRIAYMRPTGMEIKGTNDTGIKVKEIWGVF